MSFGIFMVLTAASALSLAAAATADLPTTTSVPFFRSPHSLFPSGQASPDWLAQNLLKTSFATNSEWNMSALSGHGQVYWKYQTPQAWLAPSPESKLSTEQILQKPILSLAFHPENSHMAVVSAHGIYLTEDGKSWQQLKNFNDQDLPVAINSKGDIVVGGFISYDHGKEFTPYLRWEEVTRALQQEHRNGIQKIELLSVQFLSTEKLQLTVDIGSARVQLQGLAKEPQSWLVR